MLCSTWLLEKCFLVYLRPMISLSFTISMAPRFIHHFCILSIINSLPCEIHVFVSKKNFYWIRFVSIHSVNRSTLKTSNKWIPGVMDGGGSDLVCSSCRVGTCAMLSPFLRREPCFSRRSLVSSSAMQIAVSSSEFDGNCNLYFLFYLQKKTR